MPEPVSMRLDTTHAHRDRDDDGPYLDLSDGVTTVRLRLVEHATVEEFDGHVRVLAHRVGWSIGSPA